MVSVIVINNTSLLLNIAVILKAVWYNTIEFIIELLQTINLTIIVFLGSILKLQTSAIV